MGQLNSVVINLVIRELYTRELGIRKIETIVQISFILIIIKIYLSFLLELKSILFCSYEIYNGEIDIYEEIFRS